MFESNLVSEHYKVMIDSCSNGLLLINSNGRIEFANNSAKEIFNYGEELLGLPIDLLIPANKRRLHKSLIEEYVKNPQKRQMGIGLSLSGYKKSGEEFPLEIGLNFYKSEGSLKIILSVIDISERASIQREIKEYYKSLNDTLHELQEQKRLLAKSEEKYRSIISNIDDVYYQIDKDERIVFLSPSALRYNSAKNIQDLIGLNVVETFYYDSSDRVRLLEAMKKNGGSIDNYEIVIKGKKALPINFSVNAHFLVNSKEQVCGVEGILRNITDKKKTELLLKESNDKIAKAYLDIRDSMKYAKTIQDALLCHEAKLKEVLNSYFIFYKPKEEVGGDFFYVDQVGNLKYFVVADCTGHGIPGALLTILAINNLRSIVRECITPAKILNRLREKIKNTFRGLGGYNNNGFDIALCAYDAETMKLDYAGAFSPLIIISDNQLIRLTGTRNPVGDYPKEIPFDSSSITLKPKDKLYLFSDGFQDQFGGIDNKKYGRRKFHDALLSYHKLPMHEQGKLLQNTFNKWKANEEQTDDVTIMGIEV